ncbi:pilus assembly protein [Desulfogranum mediterraneum]|uniref:hypothetical protein n=1 Tax=Desulfogranum mediterraneum TaxID=160661 RepID=UPI0003F94A3A|nr:hypothetical protein [Desulfogranum mediterraneum]
MHALSRLPKHLLTTFLFTLLFWCLAGLSLVSASQNYTMAEFNDFPINIVEEGATPRVVINASNDHQLYYKVYSDYADLDGDALPETGYKHAVDYYGYFDSHKCYYYDPADKRFVADAISIDKYCNDGVTAADENHPKKQWSGNFLNWVAMARIDAIRKVLFGGHRRVDTATTTVLERTYIPHDAHSWAKYYGGSDLEQLVPFVAGVDYDCDLGNVTSLVGSETVVNAACADPANDPDYFECTGGGGDPAACSDTSDPYNYDCADFTLDDGSNGYNACKGLVMGDQAYARDRFDYDPKLDYLDQDEDGTAIDWKKVGVTFGNTTDVPMANYNNKFSEDYAEPPLIKAVKGNHSLWASNERWQCTWRSGSPYDNHGATNANNPSESKIYAYTNNPAWSERLGEGNYVARVQVCQASWLAKEKLILPQDQWNSEHCKLYPGADELKGTADDIYKPIGLLQAYGDEKQMQFGMVAGSYNQHASGGVLIRNVGDLDDEVNVDTDGTFPKVAQYAGGPSTNNTADGLINAWSLYRIIGYGGSDGTYNSNQGDNCSWGLSKFSDVTKANTCRNWGNPFSEIYYQSINYLAGGGVIGDYRDNSSNIIPGLPVPQTFKDPLDKDSYCAKLFIVNLNASTISYDYDELDHNSYGPPTIWDEAVLPGDKDSAAMTDTVGVGEQIHGQSYFIGEIDLGSGSDDQLCTEKTITSLGESGGICPEAPRLLGSYRMAGLAYYAHVEDIRPDDATGGRGLESTQTVDTFSVALASGLPVIEIPDPSGVSSEPLVTILPACRNTSLNPNGNCAIVEFKIVSQTVDTVNKVARGSFYVNWEDSEQGGDYDQDMWGTINYELDLNTGDSGEIKITTQVHAQSTGYKMGFGYILGGTTDDGFHAHSGINGFSFAETADAGSPSCSDSNGCNCRGGHGPCNTSDSGPSVKTYGLGTATATLLKDPLWYAAKWGGFTDANDNKLPDLQSEWDSKINESGDPGSDGIPDNYFFATNPQELEDSLTRVFDAILERTSSGTAAAVVSSNVSGEGALFQAYYEPLRKDADKEARWLGTLQALWLDSFGLTREDCTPPADLNIDADGKCKAAQAVCVPNGRLDNYCVDQVVETYFDDLEGRTRMRIYESDEPYHYTSYSMQGVVSSYTGGTVNMVPNSMEGRLSYASESITLSPYQLSGVVTAYDPASGSVEISVAAGAWQGPDDASFSLWKISSDLAAGVGFSDDSLTFAAGSYSLTISPAGPWIDVGHTLTLETKNLVGASGQSFNSWTVACLEGGAASGIITQTSIQLNNAGETSSPIITQSGDFSTCLRARLSTYNLKGKAGESYADWEVSNLKTVLGKGTSTSTITLANDGVVGFSVLPTDDWLSLGDQVLVANYKAVTKELYEIGYLWNAREELYLPGVSDALLATQRDYELTTAEKGRHIITWIDANANNEVDADEQRDFVNTMLTDPTDPVSYTYFDVADQATASNLIDYIRGIEQAGSRNRTITYSAHDAGENVMRLGDIVNSTPTVVGSPQEAFDLLYYDDSYREFRQQYIDRRIVVYAGGNDGLIHAFNGGFYNIVEVDDRNYVEYSTVGSKHDDTPALQHPLGSELWAYAPLNLLSHLQWLQDPDYASNHVSYNDLKPRVFDAKIFADNDDHPNGWGTVLVVGMNLGGGAMTIAVDSDNDGTLEPDITRRSAYVIFDVTNPEVEPKLLGEITLPDQSFTSVYPAVAAFQDIDGDTNCDNDTEACNRWYLVFGSGPNILSTYESTQNARLYYFDLGQLVSGTPAPTGVAADFPADCSLGALTTGSNIVSCDTKVDDSFVGTPTVVDWDLDFRADSLYFGLVGDSVSESGRVMKMAYNNEEATTEWSDLVTLHNSGRPIYAQVVPALDDLGNHWTFFGSGRYFSAADKTSTASQRLFGVKDMEASASYPVLDSKLLDVTNAEVYSDGVLEANSVTKLDGTALTKFTDLEEEVDTNALGWKMDLPLIVGAAGDPSTRSVTRSALLGGVLFSTVFQPSEDPCAGEGQSRLYGLYYKTGTGYPSIPPVFGAAVETVGDEVKFRTLKFMDLGSGAATSPAVHSGKGSGDSGLKVFTQLSTGAMVESEAETINKVRAGRTSWQDR